MIFKIVTPPALEPVTLAEVKLWLRIDSTSLADGLTENQSIAPGSHAIAAAYSLEGTGISVSGKMVLVSLNAGACGSGGTVDVKIQESPDDVTYSDVASGSFTQVTEANDSAVYELAYTGPQPYLRAVATVAGAACEFSVSIMTQSRDATLDTLLTSLIQTAREYVEKTLTGRALITQTIDQYFDAWPGFDEDSLFKLAMPSLQSVTGVYYTDSDGNETEFGSDYYDVDTVSVPGCVSLGYGASWPTATLTPRNPIRIRFVAGYGDAQADVPEAFKTAIKFIVAELFSHPEINVAGPAMTKIGLSASKQGVLDNLLADYRDYRIF